MRRGITIQMPKVELKRWFSLVLAMEVARGGRPKVPLEIRQLIREMSLANPPWGAPRIHGELLKLGIDIG
jgi:hypothetical protein